jgi:hypothetical protein
LRFNPVLGASDEHSSEAADEPLRDVLGGISNIVVTRRSLLSCGVFGDGNSLRVHNEEERANEEGRAARARAREASSIATWSLWLTPGSASMLGEGVNKLSSEETPSLVAVCME